MHRWRVGEDRGSKETDGCPLTPTITSKEVEVFAGNCFGVQDIYL
jgi:hypothetical protein